MNRNSPSVYRILVRSALIAWTVCWAGILICCASCNQRTVSTGTTPLSETAVTVGVDSAAKPGVEVSELEPIEIEVIQGEARARTSETSRPVLRVLVRGAKSTAGVYSCALFDSEETLKERTDSLKNETFPATESEITWEIQTLPPGRYSVAVFHDANENGKLDRHALGYPLEAYGFSNNARGKFGPPPYEKIEFELGSEPQEMSIQLK